MSKFARGGIVSEPPHPHDDFFIHPEGAGVERSELEVHLQDFKWLHTQLLVLPIKRNGKDKRDHMLRNIEHRINTTERVLGKFVETWDEWLERQPQSVKYRITKKLNG